ncbi:MAG: LUD domain-containing protein [Opitutales bacterium]|nr:LUD domain-containing protein [Opitutales bacterium]
MTDRDKVLSAVRKALEPLPERAAYPEWQPDLAVARHARDISDIEALFRQRLEAVHGVFLDGFEAIPAFLRGHSAETGVVDPELLPRLGNALDGFKVETVFDRARPDDFAFGITRAAGAVAESGTIVLNDAVVPSRLAALAPWVHIAVVERATLVGTIPEAVAAFDDDPSIIFVTGPSKTADIEGILIEGVHGPGVQACCLV